MRKPPATLYTYQGESLPLSVWSKRLGISLQTLRSRLRAGWSMDDTFSTAPDMTRHPRHTGELVTFNGRTAPLGTWAAEAGLTKNLLEVRLAKGWTFADAISTPAEIPVVKAPKKP